MHNSDKIHLASISQYADYDPFFEEEYFQDLELDGELNQFLDLTDLDDPGDSFWYEN